MEAEVGLRVVRGPDWQWGDQDGGEGCLGTITELGGQGNAAEGALPLVLWDYGYRSNNYRCGKEGKYDLIVYDSAPAGEPILYALQLVYENHLSAACSGMPNKYRGVCEMVLSSFSSFSIDGFHAEV